MRNARYHPRLHGPMMPRHIPPQPPSSGPSMSQTSSRMLVPGSGIERSHVGRSVPSSTFSTAEQESTSSKRKTRVIIVLGVMLPVLACIIGIAAWAVTTDVVSIPSRGADNSFVAFGSQGKAKKGDVMQDRIDPGIDVFLLPAGDDTTEIRKTTRKMILNAITMPSTSAPPSKSTPAMKSSSSSSSSSASASDIISKLISSATQGSKKGAPPQFVVFAPVPDTDEGKMKMPNVAKGVGRRKDAGGNEGMRKDNIKIDDETDLVAEESVSSDEVLRDKSFRDPVHKPYPRKHQPPIPNNSQRLKSTNPGQMKSAANSQFGAPVANNPNSMMSGEQPMSRSITNRVGGGTFIPQQQPQPPPLPPPSHSASGHPPQSSSYNNNNRSPGGSYSNGNRNGPYSNANPSGSHNSGSPSGSHNSGSPSGSYNSGSPSGNPIGSYSNGSPVGSFDNSYNKPNLHPSPPQQQHTASYQNAPPSGGSMASNNNAPPKYYAPPPQTFHTSTTYNSQSQQSKFPPPSSSMTAYENAAVSSIHPDQSGGPHHHHHHHHHHEPQHTEDRQSDASSLHGTPTNNDADRLGTVGIGLGVPRGITLQLGGLGGLLPIGALGLIRGLASTLLPRPQLGLNRKIFFGVELGKGGGISIG